MGEWSRIFAYEFFKWKRKLKNEIVNLAIFVVILITIQIVPNLLIPKSSDGNALNIYTTGYKDAGKVYVEDTDITINYYEVSTKNKGEDCFLKDSNGVWIFKNDHLIRFNSCNTTSLAMKTYGKEIMIRDNLFQKYPESSNEFKKISFMNLVSGMDYQTRINIMLLPMIFLPLLFSTASRVVYDSVAGEKARGTFSKLLLSPVSYKSIVAGKMMFGMVYSGSQALIYICILKLKDILVDLLRLPVDKSFISSISGEVAILLILYCVISCVLFSGIALAISLRVRTKSSAALLIMFMDAIVFMLALSAVILMGNHREWEYFIPIYNINLIIGDIYDGLFLMRHMWITFGSVIVLSICFCLGCVWTLSSLEEYN